jgi:hypothetical protein
MPGLTVTEKSHWRDRIAARIDKAAERIKGRHPALFDRVARQAHTQALASLGLTDAHAELEAIRAEEATLARRNNAATRRENRTAPRLFDCSISEHRFSRCDEHLLFLKFNGS